jgi:hypothetical protein
MPLSPEEIAAAEKMHTFVQAHERYHRQSILINCFTIPLVFAGSFTQIGGGHTALGYILLGIGISLLLAFVTAAWSVRTRYRQASIVLKVLEREHSDQLSWVEVEKHLAAVKDLEQGLANGHVTS